MQKENPLFLFFRMERDLECRICGTTPKPRSLESYGLCLEGGHMMCKECTENLMVMPKHMGPNGVCCPFCNRYPVKIKTDNVLANMRLEELIAKTKFKCETCGEGHGACAIEMHEMVCAMFHRACSVCKKNVPEEDYFTQGGPHADKCFPNRCTYVGGRKNRWEFGVLLSDLFGEETPASPNMVASQERARKFLGAGAPGQPGGDNRVRRNVWLLCHHSLQTVKGLFTYDLDGEGLKVDLTWLETNFPSDMSGGRGNKIEGVDWGDSVLKVGAFCYYPQGALGRYNLGPLKTEPVPRNGPEEPAASEFSLFMARKWTDRWKKYSVENLSGCTRCACRKPHLHFSVEFTSSPQQE